MPHVRAVPVTALRWWLGAVTLLHGSVAGARRDRGDVPGWVLVTLMTATLVAALLALAGPRLTALFTDALDGFAGP